ncbi:hypothetical protein C8D70_1272 [Chryseobacterium sp. CBTAP 102]|uniref:hypothetical protein n=1 Tax=Chryseobacterium sp. CBTAP 102 TaxID=2135644 RepID=UPI000D775E37|nr:hypothetical protein [Chryseobacterium sp. CBTAP 102]PXW06318.1 hypothetical protein C8D70_1272 [Chryseobacterium sp. CBTAP 102]
MKKNLLLAGFLTTFSLVAKSQVGINTPNPQGVFNVDGLKNNPATGVPTAAQAKDDLVMMSNGNMGLGLTTAGTTLDVNGAITTRETALAVAGNAVSVPANVSLVRLTGAATANVAISAFAAPNPGQRLIVYNATTGGFGATLDGVTIPNGKALEFVFSNSFWRPTDGGSVGASPTNIYTADGTLGGNRVVSTAGNSLAFTNGTNNVTIGTTGTEGIVTAKGSSRGSFLANGGAANLSVYANDNGKAIVSAYGNSTSLDMGSSTAIPVNVFTNNTQRMTVDSGGNVGVGTSTPQEKLHINGTVQITNELNVGGTASTAGNPGTAGQVLKSNGPGVAPSWQTLAGVPNATGTIIAVNGQFIVAQEISVQMTTDYSIVGNGVATAIGSLTNEIIDNENLYTGTATSNSFKVSNDGVYLITMNVQLSVNSTGGSSPVIGIWDNGTNSWVARVNDYNATPNQLQTYTLITSIPMFASTTYSFRAANTQDISLKAFSSGSTGSGPVTQVSVKRLR